ncbi:calcium-dependent phosphotriesterase [Hypoxylon sp. NC0597]|nr:calcium-dependent phosphotriesterase [Hypoxylon sp. NC0597]
MASITKTGFMTRASPNQIADFRPGSKLETKLPPNSDKIIIKQYHPDLISVVGRETEWSLLLSSDDSSKNPLFHNGCVYVLEKNELYVMSDLLQSTSSSKLPTILISKISFRRDSEHPYTINELQWMKLRPPPSISMPSGACRYKDGILYCSQGISIPDSGGLWYMPLGKPPVPILTSYFGKPFNSIQCVVEDPEGGLWFTDASVGFEQEFRPKPQLPNQVYRFDPKTGDLRVVADGFTRPMGIALSPDDNTVYVTDTGAARPDGSIDHTRSATIYAFDIAERFGSSFLINRRVFAYVKEGVPTAVACDSFGNVFAACGDGVEVFSPGGMALGLIEVPGGCTSLCFGRFGEIFICAKQRLWRVGLEPIPREFLG